MGGTSRTGTVPASVPSLFHSSVPEIPSDAGKNKVPLRSAMGLTPNREPKKPTSKAEV